MKKAIFFFTILFTTCISDAQNWQCLQNAKHYFTNANGYLKGISIDSVVTTPDATIFYPYHTWRGNYLVYGSYLDSNGGSWLGKKVLQLADGTFLFDNLWQDTVVIKTHAHTGDSWVFYNDTTSGYYLATLVSEDTATILGSFDSVKTIKINAYNASGLVAADPVNDLRISLSKNNGFVNIVDLYTFPYHKPDTTWGAGIDYYLDFVSSNGYYVPHPPTTATLLFSLIRLNNPTYEQLYNWSAGDVFEDRVFENISDGLYPYEYHFDSITAKTVLPGSVQYSFTGWEAIMHYPYPLMVVPDMINPDVAYPYDTTSITGTFTISNALLVDTTLMPEQRDQPWVEYYYRSDTSYCLLSDSYVFIGSGMGTGHYSPPFEGSPVSIMYKADLGLVHYHWDIFGGSPPEDYDTTLLYYRKSGTTCGTYVTPGPIYDHTGIAELGSSSQIQVYPNPATTALTISSPQTIITISITNLLGQMVYAHQYSSEKVEVDVSGLPSAVYFIKINGSDSYRGEVRKFVKE